MAPAARRCTEGEHTRLDGRVALHGLEELREQDEVIRFNAFGMLITVASALDLELHSPS